MQLLLWIQVGVTAAFSQLTTSFESQPVKCSAARCFHDAQSSPNPGPDVTFQIWLRLVFRAVPLVFLQPLPLPWEFLGRDL